MNTELFIARRIMQGGEQKKRLSRPIVIISLASIILGLAIMIVTVSIVTGFQEKVRDKVIGFGSHIQITKMDENSSMESSPMLIDQEFYPSIEEREEVRKIQPFAYKPGILQNQRDSVIFQTAEKDTAMSSVDIMGILFKGVDKNYDWQFFEDKIVAGRIINYDTVNNEILVSDFLRKKMGFELGDEVDALFIRKKPIPRKYTIVGFYNTGFEQFDKQFVFTQMRNIQELNDWGVQTFLTVVDTMCSNGQFVLQARTSGGTQNYGYDWGKGFQDADLYTISPETNNTVGVRSVDFKLSVTGSKEEMNSVPDKATAEIIVDSACSCTEENLKEIKYISRERIKMPFGELRINNGRGTSHLYTGGFEIILGDWEDLEKMDEIIYDEIPNGMETNKITDLHPEIFSWLNILDMNIVIVIVLILIISLMNMITSLLVLILEKTNMIGIMKAMGARNVSIRKIFLYHSMFLLSRGLIWGNVLGLGLIFIQYFFEPITLNPEVYYLDTAPVNINIWHILLINILTLIVCRLILIIPSLLVTRIRPTRAIKFD